jgi:predicted transglutaminase-like cysteine proteinase
MFRATTASSLSQGTLATLGGLLIGFAGTSPASAADFAAAPAGTACNLAGGMPLASANPLQPASQAAPATKSQAILGGAMSALDRIRDSQENVVAISDQPETLSPAAGGVRPDASATCMEWSATAPSFARPQAGTLSGDDFLASRRLTIGHTSFDRDWRRVQTETISAARYTQLVGEGPHDRMTTLRLVNAWVNHRIAYTEDRQLFSRADFWAGARQTLKLGRGDCEDIALTKMQLLVAAGVPREALVLTIARDLVRNADHAVLIVRDRDRYYLLDNATDEVLDASTSHDYRPVLSFGQNQTWLHGY